MKSVFSSLKVGVALICMCLFIPTVEAQMADKIEVAASAICKNVVNREAVDVGTRFPSSVSRLYCFTKIVGATQPTEVFHVWSYGDVERARISLEVKSSNWRTYSSKAIQAHETGAWRVDVLDAAGNLLQTINFEVTP
ncbi:MAG: DUF2914 domain-containing protein [Desulfobacterales bacterium]|jgi:hypothetical protein